MRMTTSLLLAAFCSFFTSVSCYHVQVMTSLHNAYPDYQPNAIVDVGANAGEWSKLVHEVFPNAKLLLLEATPKHEQSLQQACTELGRAEFKISVLSAQAGDKVQFFQSGNTGNSMFRENTHHYKNAKPVERITTTLDDEIQQSFLKNERIDIIKADVQGAELLVLQGATKALQQASFVQLESGTTEYNAGGVCFWEIDAFLRSHGFYLYDIKDPTHSASFGTLGLGQFDVLYVKPTSPRLPKQFRELNGTYCGAKRNLVVSSSLSSSSSSRATKTTSSANALYGLGIGNDNNNSWTSIVSGWSGGFVVGALVCYLVTRIYERRTRSKTHSAKSFD